MPKPQARRALASRAEMPVDCPGPGDRELLGAVMTAAALTARADGWVDEQERSQLLDFIGRAGLLPLFDRDVILHRFDDRLRELEETGGAAAVVHSFRSVAGRACASLVIDVAERIAAADGHIHPGEAQALTLIRMTLLSRSWPGGIRQTSTTPR